VKPGLDGDRRQERRCDIRGHATGDPRVHSRPLASAEAGV
jgi:hypothetical protein